MSAAAITIVSKNYLSFARVLARSYKQAHPEHDFYVILVDRIDEAFDPATEPFKVLTVFDIELPDLGSFVYRYSIMELNTAVKPFALDYLFRHHKYDMLLYIDPDIEIFEPLSEVYDGLDRGNVVLIPHMRQPFWDRGHPGDLDILRSGTYNLGFIGLRRSQEVDRLLAWWMSNLAVDCVVDIAKGLFVDQKWIDLVPGFCPTTQIVRHPGYNVAYWNLHERMLAERDGGFTVDGEPLVFFHYSGYSPLVPTRLSKHQNRHDIRYNSALKNLCDQYAEKLLAENFLSVSALNYSFEVLPNGTRVPLSITRMLFQHAVRNKIPVPDPLDSPDAFVTFVRTRGAFPNAKNLSPVEWAALTMRRDVAATFPHAFDNPDTEQFQHWLARNAPREHDGDPEIFQPIKAVGNNAVAHIIDTLRENDRRDVFAAFPDMWTDPNKTAGFVGWIERHGTVEHGFTLDQAAAFARARTGIVKVLHAYFHRRDLRAQFPHLEVEGKRQGFADWLLLNRHHLQLEPEEIRFFQEFAAAATRYLARLRFLHPAAKSATGEAPATVYNMRERFDALDINLRRDEVTRWFSQKDIPAIEHYAGSGREYESFDDEFDRLSVPGMAPEANYRFVSELREQLATPPQAPVNLAAYLDATTGMGESARSMYRTLAAGDELLAAVSLPNPTARGELPSDPGQVFGIPSNRARMSVTVVNADSVENARTFLPYTYWADHNVGYWVWETERLPSQFRVSQEPFDEIWTPSRYSANAIAATVDRPVHVMNHALDFAALDEARANRAAFGLPEDKTLFGFMFDPKSILERKNVFGLVEAFQSAFRKDDECVLVLKVNDVVQGLYEFERLRARCDRDRVIFVESTFDRPTTNNFLASLDAYVSLHRSEGFGLTCAEAMAIGRPVIASNYSGNLEFMTEQNSRLVKTDRYETDRPYGPYPAGTVWGDPDLEDAVAALRELRDNERRRTLGAAGQRDVRTWLDPKAVYRRLSNLIDDRAAA